MALEILNQNSSLRSYLMFMLLQAIAVPRSYKAADEQ